MNTFTFSGHETFALRISWLPKAVAALEEGKDPFKDPREGMVTLGLGKNMVRSLAFWTGACGLTWKEDNQLKLTKFGKSVFSRESGFDPFLEDNQTLWLLHWHLCQGWGEGKNRKNPYAWYYFSSILTSDEIYPSEALEVFHETPNVTGKALSPVTLRQHFDIFIKTYVHSMNVSKNSTPEDALDSPLTTLELITLVGERRLLNGKRETVYRVNDSAHVSIEITTMRYLLHQWWKLHRQTERTATLREVAFTSQSPGKCCRIPEIAVYKMVKTICEQYPEEFAISDNQSQRVITRKCEVNESELLRSIYVR